jgi:hypothetical protein
LGDTSYQAFLPVIYHLKALQTRLELPKPEIKGFAGDPLNYARFMTAFKQNVESRTSDPGELYQNLRKYCSGRASDVIVKYDMLSGDQAYSEAKQELWLNVGQPHIIT